MGRYDYVLVGLDTAINDEVISLIKAQLDEDIQSEHPSLLAKWLPSHRTHNIDSITAKKIMSALNMTEKEYRKTLSNLRNKLNIVEKNLTDKKYENIDFNHVPTKAMLKYTNAYINRMSEKYSEYKNKVKTGETKINTEGLFAYEIVKNILWGNKIDEELYDLMWNNQKDVLKGCNTNVLVMADTSGSMTCYGGIPYATSVGLALYTAERAFELILETARDNKLKQRELPSHLLIISDMEFDRGVYSENGTNLNGWKQSFKSEGYELPTIIFWNVAGSTKGVPATKFDNDVAMISGFSTNILDNLLTLENYTPANIMLEKLSIYLEMLNVDKKN